MTNLSKLSTDQLLKLRDEVRAEIGKRHEQLLKLEREFKDFTPVRASCTGSSLKGTKVKPKYKGPNGQTWAGRGMQPKWLAELVKKGKKLESFAI